MWYNTPFRHDPGRAGDEATRAFMAEAGLDPNGNLMAIGCGKQTRNLLMPLVQGEEPSEEIVSSDNNDGNGPIIRLAPLPIFCVASSEQECMDMARRSSRSTHTGLGAAESAAFLAFAIQRAINRPVAGKRGLEGEPIRTFLDGVTAEFAASCPHDDLKRLLSGEGEPEDSKELMWNWKAEQLEITKTIANRGDDYNGHGPTAPHYCGAYALDGLAMALWAVYRSTSTADAIITCANLLGDADSTAAVAGQLAGAFYGAADVDPRLVALLRRWDPEQEMVARAVLLLVQSCERSALR